MNFIKSLFSNKGNDKESQNLPQLPAESPALNDTKEPEKKQSPTSSQCDSQGMCENEGCDAQKDALSRSSQTLIAGQQAKTSASGLGSILISLLKGKLGMDVMSAVSLPASFYEPLTILQRSCETLAHSPLLDQASLAQEPLERLVWIATFGISGYSGSERFYTNFNPLLGETFEYVDKRNGMRFLAEQVCHHPPITASHAENDNFVFWQDTRVKTTFLGNSVDINTQARTHVFFPRTKDHFFYLCPVTRVHNLIIGSLWLEHYGELKIINETTQDTAVVTFKKSGFFEGTHYEFEGVVRNAQGQPCVRLFGKWNEAVHCEWLVSCGIHKPKDTECLWRVPVPYYDTATKWRLTPFAYELLKPTVLITLSKSPIPQTSASSVSSSTSSVVTTSSTIITSSLPTSSTPNGSYDECSTSCRAHVQKGDVATTEGTSQVSQPSLPSDSLSQHQTSLLTMTTSTQSVVLPSSTPPQLPTGELSPTELTALAEKVLCITDSRLRPDRRWLEYGHTDLATVWKRTLEERQRLDRRLAEQYAATVSVSPIKDQIQSHSLQSSATVSSVSAACLNTSSNATENSQSVFVPYTPVWFKKIPDGEGGTTWVYTGHYWQQREEKEKLLLDGKEQEAQKLLQPRCVQRKACDFRSYQSTPQLPLPPSPVEYRIWQQQQQQADNKK